MKLESLISEMTERVPERDTLLKMISSVRRPTSLEEPWSLGVSPPEIPHEATGDLLAVYKFCLAADWKFSIREARWVARLRSALPGGNPALLLEYAVLYSRRERAAQKSRRPVDTSDLDTEIAFQPWASDLNAWEFDQALQLKAVHRKDLWQVRAR